MGVSKNKIRGRPNCRGSGKALKGPGNWQVIRLHEVNSQQFVRYFLRDVFNLLKTRVIPFLVVLIYLKFQPPEVANSLLLDISLIKQFDYLNIHKLMTQSVYLMGKNSGVYLENRWEGGQMAGCPGGAEGPWKLAYYYIAWDQFWAVWKVFSRNVYNLL